MLKLKLLVAAAILFVASCSEAPKKSQEEIVAEYAISDEELPYLNICSGFSQENELTLVSKVPPLEACACLVNHCSFRFYQAFDGSAHGKAKG